MLTIKNYKDLQNYTFTIKSGWEWLVMDIEERDDKYIIAVLPFEPNYRTWSLGGNIIYTLYRTPSKVPHWPMHKYMFTNSKDDRVRYIPPQDLTRRNFELELGIQTALLHQ
jgi:hypothetical protein